MDLTDSIAPKSDQLNAEDLLTGPRTFTVADVKKGSAEQPVDIHLVEFPGRPFRPSKTVRRILVNAWGAEASAYIGRRMTLYRDPNVKFGGMDVGGIRVSHLSHIDKPISVALTVSRGKRQPYTVQPLAEQTTGAGRAEGEAAKPAPAPDKPTREQNAAMDRMFLDTGTTDRLAKASDVLGRVVTSGKELTREDASRLISHMARELGEVAPDEDAS